MPLPITVSVLRRAEDLVKISGEWGALYARIADTTPAQGPVYCLSVLMHADPLAVRLSVVVARNGEKLVGIWPLWVVHENRLAVVRHISAGSNEEYAGPLCDEMDALPAMLTTARCEGDVLHVCGIRQSSPLAQFVGGWYAHHGKVASPVVRCAEMADLDAWLAVKSKNFRSKYRRECRQLGQLGKLRLSRVELHEVDTFVDWLFDTKIAWADRNALKAAWLRRDLARKHAKWVLSRSDSGVIGTGLWLDGRLIAAAISLVGSVFEHFVTTYDPEFNRYSPGQILRAYDLSEAISLRLDFDLRITHDAYKARWIDDVDLRVTLTIANSWRSAPLLIRRHVRDLRCAFGRWLRGLGNHWPVTRASRNSKGKVFFNGN